MIGNNNYQKYQRSQNRNLSAGYTIIELVVAIGIFSTVVLGATSIFQLVVAGQSYAIASFNTQETMRYDFEIMAKELRTAKVDEGGTCKTFCGVSSANRIYYSNTDDNASFLCFKNEKDQCVRYYLIDNRLMINRQGSAYPITPDEIRISALSFKIQEKNMSNTPIQPKVTMKLVVENIGKNLNKQTMVLQQSISSRNYE